MKPIYLDYNATTPIDPEVAEAMRPFLYEHFGNPSSAHWYGAQTKRAVELARRQVAGLLDCRPDEVIFTSGGSESNNHAIKGVAFALRSRGNHLVTSSVEHPAVIEVCRFLEQRGFRVTYLPVDGEGRVDPGDLERAITPQTVLVSIMHANNEVGTIQPIAELAAVARARDVLFHTDAAQSPGKIPVRIGELGVDLLSLAGHKLYAPKGVGALFVRRGVQLEKQIHGADHERNLRAGTENVLLVVGLGRACEIAARDLERNATRMRATRDRLHAGLERELGPLRLNGHPEERLPNTLSLGFAGIEADTLLTELEQVAASAGAACHAESVELSPVLTAMAVPEDYAMGTVRLSTGRATADDEIDQAVEMIAAAVRRLRPQGAVEPAAAPSAAGEIKLTRFTHGLGCACKLRPQALEEVLRDLPVPKDARVLVGTGTADDAAVYLVDDRTAIVQTVDFFTPVVDDPEQFGAIAAANALSDIYAMGGKPLFALNIVGFPTNRLPLEVLHRILRGAQEVAARAGVSIVGGHTVDDTEPKYGLAVTGRIDPARILTNAAAKPGDAIVLTKPIGTGILATAMKRGLVGEATVARAVAVMSALNREAAEAMEGFPVSACTDVTGFGLLGHLKEMARGSGVDAEIDAERVPLIEEALELAAANVVPGGSVDNLGYVEDAVLWPDHLPRPERLLLCDAQTSGGLLIALPSDDAAALMADMARRGVSEAALIGRFTVRGPGRIVVRSA
jgi:cysteine desulfurase NifS/selenium donor protein